MRVVFPLCLHHSHSITTDICLKQPDSRYCNDSYKLKVRGLIFFFENKEILLSFSFLWAFTLENININTMYFEMYVNPFED